MIDTNVLVSAMFGGPPRTIVRKWARGEITLCLSREIVDEYIRVLPRFGIGEQQVAWLLELLRLGRNAVYAHDVTPLQVVAADPDDDKFIACAVALKADCIISGDGHLLAISDYMGIPILTRGRPSSG